MASSTSSLSTQISLNNAVVLPVLEKYKGMDKETKKDYRDFANNLLRIAGYESRVVIGDDVNFYFGKEKPKRGRLETDDDDYAGADDYDDGDDDGDGAESSVRSVRTRLEFAAGPNDPVSPPIDPVSPPINPVSPVGPVGPDGPAFNLRARAPAGDRGRAVSSPPAARGRARAAARG